MSHFIVSTVAGCMITLCGKTIGPHSVAGAKVGIYGEVCKACQDGVKEAWVTIKSA